MKKTVLLGVTSSIAAYKSLDLVKKLQEENVDVTVIMTKNATTMIPSIAFEKLLKKKIYTDLFEADFDYKDILVTQQVEHIQLADATQLMVIAPATANILAKLAHGIADDLLTTTALAVTVPIVIAPAMNVHMWNHPTVQKNITILKSMGYIIVDPTEGMLACGYVGKGKLENIDVIYEEVKKQLNKTLRLKNKKIIVTAGGTTEPIDDVRVITNKSSGKMGIALAEELYLQGAEVLLLRAKSAVTSRYLLQEQLFTTSEELSQFIKKYAPAYDAIFHAAAIADFSVEKNIGKLSSDIPHALSLIPQRKIVEQIKSLNPAIQLFAFKAVHGENELVEKAKKKLETSHADAVIANDVSGGKGFEKDENEVTVVTKNEAKKFSLKSKREIAKEIIDFLL